MVSARRCSVSAAAAAEHGRSGVAEDAALHPPIVRPLRERQRFVLDPDPPRPLGERVVSHPEPRQRQRFAPEIADGAADRERLFVAADRAEVVVVHEPQPGQLVENDSLELPVAGRSGQRQRLVALAPGRRQIAHHLVPQSDEVDSARLGLAVARGAAGREQLPKGGQALLHPAVFPKRPGPLRERAEVVAQRGRGAEKHERGGESAAHRYAPYLTRNRKAAPPARRRYWPAGATPLGNVIVMLEPFSALCPCQRDRPAESSSSTLRLARGLTGARGPLLC